MRMIKPKQLSKMKKDNGNEQDARGGGYPDANRLFFDEGFPETLGMANGGHSSYPPACVLHDLAENGPRSASHIKTVAEIVIRNPALVSEVGVNRRLRAYVKRTLDTEQAVASANVPRICGCYEALAEFSGLSGRFEMGFQWYSKSVDLQLDREALDMNALSRTVSRFRTFMESFGRKEEAKRVVLEIRLRISMCRKAFEEARFLARQLVGLGEFEKTEAAYVSMLEAGFTPVSTYCHIARVRMLKRDFKGSEEAVEKAHSLSERGSNYAQARVYYYRALFRFMKNKSAQSDLLELKELLKRPDVHMDWEIDEMLLRVKNRLSAKHYCFIKALGEALQSRKAAEELKQNLFWRISVLDIGERLELCNDPWRRGTNSRWN